MATYFQQVTTASATATTDLANIGAGVAATGDISTRTAVSNLSYVHASYDASGRAFVVGAVRTSASYVDGTTHGMLSLGVATGAAFSMGAGRFYPPMLDLSGNLRVALTANQSVAISGTATVVGNVGVSAGSITATANVSSWGASAVSPSTAITGGMTLNYSVPMIGAIGVGYRSDGTTNYDPATLSKLFDMAAGANVENVLGVSLRAPAAAGSVAIGVADNGPFVDNQDGVVPAGYIVQDAAGTTLTQSDVAVARMDLKRAQVFVMEDATTRGRRAEVNVVSAVSVQQWFVTGSAGAATATANTGARGVAVTGSTLTLTYAMPREWTMYAIVSSNASACGTAYLQVSPDNSNWIGLTSISTALFNGSSILSATASVQAIYARVISSASLATGGAGNVSATASAWMMGGY